MGAKNRKQPRVKIKIDKSDYDALVEIAQSRGKTLSQYLASAIAIQAYVDAKRKEGATFLIETPGWLWDTQREIIFH